MIDEHSCDGYGYELRSEVHDDPSSSRTWGQIHYDDQQNYWIVLLEA